MAQPSGQVLVDSGHALAGALFAYANGSGIWDATNGAMLAKVGSGAVTTEGGANVATSNADTYYTLASTITLSGAFSIGFRARQTASDSRSMVLGQHTTTTSYIWLNVSGSARFAGGLVIGANGGTTSMATWHVVRDGKSLPIRLYKDGVLQATLANSGSADLTISALLKAYSSNTSYDFAGAIEWVHVFPAGKVLNQTEIDSLVADPYQMLQAAGGTDATASGSTTTATATLLSGAATGGSAGSAAGVTLAATASLVAGSAFGGIGSTITMTAPAAYRMHQRNVVTSTASVTISGTYTGSPGSIQYRFAGGAWQTLVASPTGGAFSQSVTLPTGQGALEVRFSSDTGVTASRALVGVGDVFIVAGQSNNVGAATEVVQPVAAAFTAIEYDASDVWKPLQEGLATGTSFSGLSGYGGSYFGALSNRLQANGVPVAFVPSAVGSTRVSDWQRNASNPASTATLYGRALTQQNEVGGCRALIWWQGESDANNGTDSATFQSLTNATIDGWMTDTGKPVFMVKITNFHANAPTIRAAQDAIAAGNANVVGIADGGGAYTGNVHYLTAAQINAVADAIYPEFVDAFYAASATASGATLTATASLQAGGASGMGSATAPGITLEAVAQLLAGIASGGSTSTAAGVTVTATASMLPGAASGQRSATANGALWSAAASVMAGGASNGSIVWPTTAAGPTHRAIVPFNGVRAIVTAETVDT